MEDGRENPSRENPRYLHDENMGKPLRDFLRNMQTGGPKAILEEYRMVQSMDKEYSSTKCDSNVGLNRWGDIKCFDSTRVTLLPPRDYIHANYVDGFQYPKKFICTQGPLKQTINDFWRMVWQEKTVVIIALTKVRGAKCELYFPDEQGTAMQYGSIKVQNQRVQDVRDTYGESTLRISKGEEKRTVTHLLYHAWPDKGTPDSSSEFLNFMDHFNDRQKELTKRLIKENQWKDPEKGPPIIVHCSAGVGRTGTLCALDVIAERLRRTEYSARGPLVSVGQTVKVMRTQRHKAVQRPEQYLFLYLGVAEYALKHRMVEPEKVDVSAFMMKPKPE